MSDYDYEEKTASTNQLQQLGELAAQQAALELKVAEAEEALKEAKRELSAVKEVAIPELMADVGMDQFRTTSGLTVRVTSRLHAKLTDKNRGAAVSWLRDHGLGRVIKSNLTMDFERADDEKAKEVVDFLTNSGISFTQKDNVHHSTLSATLKELKDSGVDVPTDLFNAYERKTAKIG